ncbi:MAG: YraN family protein [Deltaproteobacteria bacterium]|nr:YraN family protein [Deltaproteobacteria bacterium]
MYNKKIGNEGEEVALYYLEKKSFKIIEKNYSVKVGEIDIIASKNNVLHFIEVKTRVNDHFGAPYNAITHSKIKKISRAARCFLLSYSHNFSAYQFDVISLVKDKSYKVHFIENAFDVSDFYSL